MENVTFHYKFLEIFDAKNLSDYKPLINQGTPSNVIFWLHHHVSAVYSNHLHLNLKQLWNADETVKIQQWENSC